MTHKAARAYSRVFFASAHDEVPGQAGPGHHPARTCGSMPGWTATSW